MGNMWDIKEYKNVKIELVDYMWDHREDMWGP